MDKYTSIERYSKFEYEDRKSVFIGEASPVTTEDEALSFIASVKKKYPDARHHVYAYVLRENSLVQGLLSHLDMYALVLPVDILAHSIDQLYTG